MKKTRFSEPYRKDGKTTYRSTYKRAGVYLIKENAGLVYVGMISTNLYRTLYRHFERWTHRGQEVVTYAGRMNRHRYTVRVILCTPAQAARLERALIVRHRPRDNENKFSQYTLNLTDKKYLADYEQLPAAIEAPF